MGKRILIVDDEEDLVESLKVCLEGSGYEVMTALDGAEGLEKARDERPNLIFLDIMMPKMNGYQVCRFLKFDERFKHIPIIILTARGQEKDAKLALQVGADDYIIKPFDHEELLKKIKSHLK